MLARWLRILTLMELIGAGALAWLLADRGAGVPASLAIGLAAPFLVHGAIIALDFGLAAWAGSPTSWRSNPSTYRRSPGIQVSMPRTSKRC